MAQQANPAIKVQGISKTFGTIQALRDVSFSVPGQTVFSILGPNGAGKTTLMRILTTVTHPDSGMAEIEGYNIASRTLAVRQLIGIVAQDNRFDRYLSIWHNLTLHAKMHGMERADYEPRIQELLEKVGLFDRRFSLADELSGGMQRRVALIRALIHRPKVLFLDEPTTGLDPQARLEIWETIETFKQHATVVLTTHYMEEADRLSDTIMMINLGQVVNSGTPRQLKQLLSPLNKYELVLNVPHAKDALAHIQPESEQSDFTQINLINDYTLQFTLADPRQLEALFKWVPVQEVLRLGKVEANLEDVFLALSGETFHPKMEDNL
jgi:ABC-2 type transport system ATP-binding protein